MLKWHRDAFLGWSQFCVIPAHMQTTPNHPSAGFKETVRGAYRRLRPALRCVSIRGGEMREVRGREGLGVWWKTPQCNSWRGLWPELQWARFDNPRRASPTQAWNDLSEPSSFEDQSQSRGASGGCAALSAVLNAVCGLTCTGFGFLITHHFADLCPCSQHYYRYFKILVL